MATKKTGKIAILAGDGIGPEIMAEALKILDRCAKKYDLELEKEFKEVGGVAYDKFGTPLPAETIKACESSDAILFGAVGGPKWENLPPEKQPERGALLPLRKHFDLFGNLRPAIIYPELTDNSPLKREIIGEGVDIMIVRELTGGIYFGQPKEKTEEYALDTLIYKRHEVERIAHLAFQLARKRDKRVTSVDKANVLTSMVFWRDIVIQVHRKYPDVELNHLYVDNAAMQLVVKPREFDVILTGNMFGDILSDEASVLTGSLGMLPSASLSNGHFGLYEPAGGSAPDIAGKGMANPIAQILSGALMLKYSFGLDRAFTDIENAIREALKDGYRTQDIARQEEKISTTAEIGEAILKRLYQ